MISLLTRLTESLQQEPIKVGDRVTHKDSEVPLKVLFVGKGIEELHPIYDELDEINFVHSLSDYGVKDNTEWVIVNFEEGVYTIWKTDELKT